MDVFTARLELMGILFRINNVTKRGVKFFMFTLTQQHNISQALNADVVVPFLSPALQLPSTSIVGLMNHHRPQH